MGLLNVEACPVVYDYSPFSFDGQPPTDYYQLTLLITDAVTGQPRDGVGQDAVELISPGASPTTILQMTGFSSVLSQHGLYQLTVGGSNPMANGADSVGVFVTIGVDRGQSLYVVDVTGRPLPEHNF